MQIYPPVCLTCRHYKGMDDEKGEGICSAFPEGIPEAIFIEGNPHKEPYPGDGGIQYEPDA